MSTRWEKYLKCRMVIKKLEKVNSKDPIIIMTPANQPDLEVERETFLSALRIHRQDLLQRAIGINKKVIN